MIHQFHEDCEPYTRLSSPALDERDNSFNLFSPSNEKRGPGGGGELCNFFDTLKVYLETVKNQIPAVRIKDSQGHINFLWAICDCIAKQNKDSYCLHKTMLCEPLKMQMWRKNNIIICISHMLLCALFSLATALNSFNDTSSSD